MTGGVPRGAPPVGVYCCVAPRVLRVPSGPAAREIATRELRSEWSISKPALALRTLRHPPHQWCPVAVIWFGASPRSPARPCRRPRALRPGSPGPPVPSTPVGPDVLISGSARRLVVRPGLGLLHVAQFWLPIITFACNSPAACSNIEFASLELQRFLGLLKFGPIELHAKFVWLWSCRLPSAPWRVPAARGPPVPSGPSGAHGHRSLALRARRCPPHQLGLVADG